MDSSDTTIPDTTSDITFFETTSSVSVGIRSQSAVSPSLLPIYIASGISAAIFIIGPLLVPRGPNQGLTRWCITLTITCLWMFWVIVYIAQLNPLVGPRLDNATLAWLGYCWGKDPKKV